MRIDGKTYKNIKERAHQIHQARHRRDERRNDVRSSENCLLGLLGEVIAWKQSGIGKVDFKIYPDGHEKRNFDGDLMKYVHVKTCRLALHGTVYDSWLIDKKDPLYTHPDPWDIIILCYAEVYEDHGKGTSIGFVLAHEVQHVIKPSQKIPHKVALYRKDIKDYIKPIKDIAPYGEIPFE
jgi:hypothetical protein